MHINQVFNRLTLLKELKPQKDSQNKNRRIVLCECVCGTKKEYKLKDLKSGNTKSCGCLALETRTTHGLSQHPLYHVHDNMMQRCYNKESDSYICYGARGIRVCKEWRDREAKKGFLSFYAWNESLPRSKRWRKGLQLDRKDNNKNYKPSNCRWVTPTTNSNNRRTNKIITYKNNNYSMKEFWLKFNENGITYSGFKKRIAKHMEPLKAATQIPQP